MKAKYIRVSTIDQNTDRQHSNDKGVKQFIDHCSGAVKFHDRSEAKKLIKAVEAGTIIEIKIHSIDRLGRNQIDILHTIEFFNSKKVNLYITNLGTNSLVNGKVNPAFNLIISVLSSLAQSEREQLKERQAEGIKIAKGKEKYKGRQSGSIETNQKILEKHKDIVLLFSKKMTIREIAEITKKSPTTTQKVINILRENSEV